MNNISSIIQVHGVELVPYFDAPYHLTSEFFNGKKLLGYDFFIYIPDKGIMPSMNLSQNLSTSNMTEKEKFIDSILDICNINKIIMILSDTKSHSRKDIGIFFTEGVKYLNKFDSNTVVGYEFIYE